MPETDFYTLIKCATIIDSKILDKSELKLVESQEYIKKLNNNFSNVFLSPDEESDDNISINCNYYSPEEFCKSKFEPSRSFSIYHINIHSIEKHIETF